MKSNLKQALMTNTPNKDIMGAFIAMLDLPDAVFDSKYLEIKTNLINGLKTLEFVNEVTETVKKANIQDIDAEIKSLDAFIKEIQEDDTLSDNKKDLLNSFLEELKTAYVNIVQCPREQVPVKIERIHPNAILPTYANPTDAGADIYAVEDVVIKPHKTEIVKTGLKVDMPAGYMIQIYPRSGLSAKTGLRVANSVGIIDHLYHKEIGVILENTGNFEYKINKGDRIAQMLILSTPQIKWIEKIVEDNERGGFGSTDIKD